MARLIDAKAFRETVEDHVTTVSVCPTVDWARGKTQFKNDVLDDIDNAPTIDAIPIDWLERRLNETAEETARGNDQVEINNAIFQVLVEWEKERRKNGEA